MIQGWRIKLRVWSRARESNEGVGQGWKIKPRVHVVHGWRIKLKVDVIQGWRSHNECGPKQGDQTEGVVGGLWLEY